MVICEKKCEDKARCLRIGEARLELAATNINSEIAS